MEETALVIAGQGVVGNDSDVDADPLSAIMVTGVAHGSLTLDPSGSFRYIPAPNYFGPDSFSYLVNDGFGDSNVATVAILVAAVNDAPIPATDGFSVAEAAVLDSGLDTVLLNDTDAGGAPSTEYRYTGPAHGAVAPAGDSPLH